jgi:hypothetical protein
MPYTPAVLLNLYQHLPNVPKTPGRLIFATVDSARLLNALDQFSKKRVVHSV